MGTMTAPDVHETNREETTMTDTEHPSETDAHDPGQCRHGWRADQCPYLFAEWAPMGPCGR